MAIARIHHVHGQRFVMPTVQYRDEAAVLDHRRHQEARHLHDAQARQARRRVGVAVVQGDPAGQRDLDPLLAAHEVPVEHLPGARREVADAAMIDQLVGMRRQAVAFHIGGRGAGEVVHGADLARDEAGIGQAALAANRAIHAFLDQVHRAIAAAQLQLDAGIPIEEIRQGGDDYLAGQAGGRVDAQASRRLAAVAGQGVLGVAHVRQDAHASFVIDRAFDGDADVARGPVQQLDRQRALQRLDQGGHGRLGQLHVVRRAGEAARVHHLDKHFHGLQLVHVRSSMDSAGAARGWREPNLIRAGPRLGPCTVRESRRLNSADPRLRSRSGRQVCLTPGHSAGGNCALRNCVRCGGLFRYIFRSITT